MKIMATSFKGSHACTATLTAPNAASGHHQPTPLLETPGYSQASLGQSPVGSLLLSPGFWCTKVLFLPSNSLFHQSCVSSGGYCGGVKGNLLQEGLCHTQVCCTQSPCPCSRPLLTPTSSTVLSQFKHSSVSVSVGSLGPSVHKICLSPLSISGQYGV